MGQCVAHRPRAVVKLHRTADEYTTGLDFYGNALHPVVKQGPNPRQATWLLHGRVKHLIGKAGVTINKTMSERAITKAAITS
jgi:hypothetical protein